MHEHENKSFIAILTLSDYSHPLFVVCVILWIAMELLSVLLGLG